MNGNPYRIETYSAPDARYNLTESELAAMPAEDAAKWRECWTAFRYDWQSDYGPRHYFLRALDRFAFEQAFLALGNVTTVNSSGEVRTHTGQSAGS